MQKSRPVSCVSFVCNDLEEGLAKRLIQHLKYNGLHEELQSTYKPRYSTGSALMKGQYNMTCYLLGVSFWFIWIYLPHLTLSMMFSY